MRMTLIAWCFLAALAGCGGSGRDRVPPPAGGIPPSEQPRGDLTVSISARDAFGVPVPDAEILLLYSSGTGFWETGINTDVNGQATIAHAPDNTYGVVLSADAIHGSRYEATEANGEWMTFEVTLHPWSSLSPGVGRIAVTDVSADGRSLTFNARLYIIETYADDLPWYWANIDVLPCESCIVGPGSSTAT